MLGDGATRASTSSTRTPASPMPLPALLLALPIHAARGQLYIPLEVLRASRRRPRDDLRRRGSAELRAALAELRRHARGT